MSKTRIYQMRCGCEFWEGIDYRGETYPEMQYCEMHEPALRAENERMVQLADSVPDMKFAREFEKLRAELLVAQKMTKELVLDCEHLSRRDNSDGLQSISAATAWLKENSETAKAKRLSCPSCGTELAEQDGYWYCTNDDCGQAPEPGEAELRRRAEENQG